MNLVQKLFNEGKIKVLDSSLHREKITLEENEFLLKVNGLTGFMTPLTKEGKLPKAFLEYPAINLENDRSANIFIIKEEFRTNWELIKIREGMSTTWFILKHPYGFAVEINAQVFNKIILKLDINKGVISTPLFFVASTKTNDLLIGK